MILTCTNNKYLLTFFSFILLNIICFAQKESLSGIDYNYTLKNNTQSSYLKSAGAETPPDKLTELPFIDDFSQTGFFADTALWSVSTVYINNDYCINPVTIGVATFDALDNTGKLNTSANLDSAFIGDELISNRINLSENNANVYLSFYYQPGGLGEVPEDKDSLILQFKARSSDSWKTVWKAVNYPKDTLVLEITGSDTLIWKPDTTTFSLFKQVILPVNDTSYFNTGFQFKFVNYITLEDDDVEGRISNADIWNIDYIKLDKGRSLTDIYINDLAYSTGLDSILNNFTSMPLEHFINGGGLQAERKHNPYFRLYNGYTTSQFFERTFEIEDMVFGDKLSEIAGNDTLKGLSSIGFKDELPGSFTDIFDNLLMNEVDTVFYKMKYYLTTNADDRKQNDTISTILELSNFYAYDDGTPEKGYGLIGQGTQNARVAVRFEPYLGDTLRGVYMFFNRPYNDITTSFRIAVWDEKEINNQKYPGDTLFTREWSTGFNDGLNEFIAFEFDTAVYIDEPFYIGWIQMKEEFLNIGFDANRDNHKNNYVNFGNQWQRSSLKGTLMIRPVFSEDKLKLGINENKQKNTKIFNTYPNPVTDRLYISDYGSSSLINYTIFDIQGRTVRNGTTNYSIDCSGLENGIYLFKFSLNNNIEYKKVLIAR